MRKLELQFENQITVTKSVLYESIATISKKRISFLVTGIAAVFLLFALLEYRGGSMGIAAVWLVGAVCILLTPKLIAQALANMQFEQQKLLNNGKEMQKTAKFQNHISVVSSNGAQTTFQYSQIGDIYESNRFILLRIRQNRQNILIILDKNNFITGKLDTFQTFIREKCPQAHFHK